MALVWWETRRHRLPGTPEDESRLSNHQNSPASGESIDLNEALEIVLVDVPRLTDKDVLFSAEARDNSINLIVRNPQRDPVSGHRVFIEDIQKYSPDVGFHPVAQFAMAQKPCELEFRGPAQLFFDEKRVYLLLAKLSEKQVRIEYRTANSQQRILLEIGTWRVRVRLDWQERQRYLDLFVRWDGGSKAPALAADPTDSV